MEPEIDQSQCLKLWEINQQLKKDIESGRVTHVEKTLHVNRSKHPVTYCVNKGYLEPYHADIAISIHTLRNCAFKPTLGRIFHGTGMGGSGIDPTTLYVRLMRSFTKRQQELIELICVAEDVQWNNTELHQLMHMAIRMAWVLEEAEKRINEINDAFRKKKEANPAYE